jgi:hypothetical protein
MAVRLDAAFQPSVNRMMWIPKKKKKKPSNYILSSDSLLQFRVKARLEAAWTNLNRSSGSLTSH